MLKHNFLLILFALLSNNIQAQSDSTMTLLFAGDIMGHDAQIISAFDSSSNSYDYESVFAPLKETINKADFAIANLELTLAGPPYKGYPQFSSPDDLAVALKNSGFDALVTANNHSVDRGGKGIIRTVDMLDSLDIKHTGTFRNQADKDSLNLMILQNDFLKVGILNYTYGTNGLIAPEPTSVNLIDLYKMINDIDSSLNKGLDKLIVVVHWGLEYQTHPNQNQKDIAAFLFNKGVDIIIGSHPHVLQKMEYHAKSDSNKETLIAYSMGNFVSNQRKRGTDGGTMIQFTLSKEDGEVKVKDQGYILTWVDKKREGNKDKFLIYPCRDIEAVNAENLNKKSQVKFQTFIEDSRSLLEKENVNFPELK